MREQGDGVDEVEASQLQRRQIRARQNRMDAELGGAEADALLHYVSGVDSLSGHALREEAYDAAVAAAEVEPAVDVVERPASGRQALLDQRDHVQRPLAVGAGLGRRALGEHEVVEVDSARNAGVPARRDEPAEAEARLPRGPVDALVPLHELDEAAPHHPSSG